MLTRSKMYAFVIFSMTLIIFLSLLSVYIREDSTREAIDGQSDIHKGLLLTREAQVHFKKQVQEWKNVLLRGHNEEDYVKYLSQFMEEESIIRNKVSLLIDHLKNAPGSRALAIKFLETHQELGRQYREALQIYFESKSNRSVNTDKAVRGIDREPTDLLDDLAEKLVTQGEIDLQKIETDLQKVSWVIIGLVVTSIIIIAYLLIGLTNRLLKQSATDRLTQLKNRKELRVQLKQNLETRSKNYMLLIDLDEFKLINEVCGYSGGDMYLLETSKKLNSMRSNNETLFRSNADEFVLLTSQSSHPEVIRRAESIRKTIESFIYTYNDSDFQTTCSIAIVEIDSLYRDIESIYTNADLAMQEAKELGRNKVILYSPLNQGISRRQQEMRSVHGINKALLENRFVLYRQKIKSFDESKHTTYYEVLIRLENPDGTMSGPHTFLPAAEKYKLMDKIDRWVITDICRHLTENPDDFDSYSVNLSGATLSDATFIKFIEETFSNLPFPTSRIGFEITETEAVKNLDNTNQILNVLKNHNCKISLDDFGTGVSSFSYLIGMNIDSVKIDGVFIKDLQHSDTNQAIVRSVIDIAKTLNITTVAEFVENKQIEEALIKMGIQYGQGFGIHKPENINLVNQDN